MPTRGCSFTCLVAVLPIRTFHTLKAAGGLPLNDSFPGPCQAVSAAVGERHLRAEITTERGCSCGISLPAPLTTCQREELGTSTSVAGSGPIQAEEGPAACVPIISEGDKCLWESACTHTHTGKHISVEFEED